MREYGLNLILPLKVLCSFELRQLETDPGFFRSHFFMILTSSVKAMQQHRIKLPLGALMLFWPPRRRNSIPSVYQCFQMGKGAMSRTQPWVGASHGGGAPFEQQALSPNWCSQSFFHCCSIAGLQPTVARELQREPSPSSLLYAAQSRTCWNHSNPILVWAQPERQIPVCMATRSASKRSQWGQPGPQGPALSLSTPQPASPDGWNTPKQRLSPLLPRLPAHDVGSSTQYSQMSGALTYPLRCKSWDSYLTVRGQLFGNARGTDWTGRGDAGRKRWKSG